MAGPARAERYEISFFGSAPTGIGITGFIDLDPNPVGVYAGSVSFMSSVVDTFEIRVTGDLRGDFIFTPGNSLIGNLGRGWDLTWEVTESGIFVSSPTAAHGPSSSLLSAFGGNQWLRLSTTQLDYRNNSNGGNQLTDYGPGPLPLAFNTYQPNGGPFVSTLDPGSPVPVPGAAWLLGTGLVAFVGAARRRRTAR
ncbi:MAG: hypothetical protein RLW42_04915 [Gammaproteobacteria bacterium]